MSVFSVFTYKNNFKEKIYENSKSSHIIYTTLVLLVLILIFVTKNNQNDFN